MANSFSYVRELLHRFPTIQARALEKALSTELISYKTATSTYSSTTTLAAVSDMQLTIEPGKYMFRVWQPLAIATVTDGLKFDLNAGTATMTLIKGVGKLWDVATFDGGTAASAKLFAITALSDAMDGGTATAWDYLEVQGTLDVLTGGTFGLQAAQSHSGATNSQALLGGYIMVKPIKS